MKKILIILLLLPTYGYAIWQGDVNLFQFDNYSARLNAPPEADTASVYQASTISAQARWQLEIQLDFVPSSANYLRFYLMAQASSLEGPLNGYFIQVGGARRNIALYKQTGRTLHLISSTEANVLADSPVVLTLFAERSAENEWSVEAAFASGKVVALPRMVDAEHRYSQIWGVFCKYTKTRNTGFAFSSWWLEGESVLPPKVVKAGQLYLSEILYDPPYKGVDFVEVYNASEAPLALETCSLSNGKTACSLPVYTLYPGEYLALTPSAEKLSSQYIQVGKLLSCPHFPPLVNNSGRVYLFTSNDTLDQLPYSDELHHPLISQTEGISLERKYFPMDSDFSDEKWEEGVEQTPNWAELWTSASTLVKATPGLPNSQASPHRPIQPTDEKWIWLSSSVFSPTQDLRGLRIYHRVPEGTIANAWIVDFSGIEQRQIYQNELLSLQGETFWDGMDAQGNVCIPGIYAVVVELILPTEKKKRCVRAVAVGP